MFYSFGSIWSTKALQFTCVLYLVCLCSIHAVTKSSPYWIGSISLFWWTDNMTTRMMTSVNISGVRSIGQNINKHWIVLFNEISPFILKDSTVSSSGNLSLLLLLKHPDDYKNRLRILRWIGCIWRELTSNSPLTTCIKQAAKAVCLFYSSGNIKEGEADFKMKTWTRMCKVSTKYLNLETFPKG